ncbi:MAG: ATP-dependent zinc metalloprotease FtsH [Geminicoccaceae bacterium]|nr:ATP-dependent zinc metalloprotease FtsH [Geminicoccaceae bacterium]
MDKKQQLHLWYVVAAAFLVLLIQGWWREMRTTEVIPYSEFMEYLDKGLVDRIAVGDQYITGFFREPQAGKTQFVTPRVDPAIAGELAKRGVQFTGVVENTFFRELLSWIVPVLVFFAIWAFVFRRFAEKQGLSGFMSVGRSKAKIYVERDTKVTFDDVAGVDEAKAELVEIVEFLRNPKEYSRLGAHIPKGVLLVGPPGTGKTLLAKAVAGEAGVPFFSISGSEFVEMFVGVGAARVRDLFEQARKAAPAIIFIDELDALGRARSALTGIGGHDEREQTLNPLLTEIDCFDPSEGVVLLGATTRPEILDPALLRAGRFDRQVLVDRPDKLGRIQILKVHIKKVKLSHDVDIEQIASITTGFSGADLANLVNEAALLATRRKAQAVSMEDFTQAVERIVAGLEKRNRVLNAREREIVAYHEMGHALVALALPGTDAVHKVSIVPRGVGALGYTIQRPTEDRFLMTKEELLNKIAVILGGRAAEKLVFDHLSTGAADDLVRATDIARALVARYGMDEELGSVAYDVERSPFLQPAPGQFTFERRYSEDTAREIDLAVRRLVDQQFERTLGILSRNREVLERCAKELLQVETLDEAALRRLTSDLRPESAREKVAA